MSRIDPNFEAKLRRQKAKKLRPPTDAFGEGGTPVDPPPVDPPPPSGDWPPIRNTVADYALNPWAAGSAYYRRIGTGAIYVTRSALVFYAGALVPINAANGNAFGTPFQVASSSDSGATITGIGFGNVGSSITVQHLPASFPNPNPSSEGAHLLGALAAEPYALLEFYNFNPGTLTASGCWKYDIRDLGHGVALGSRVGTSASGMVSFLGAVRKHEVETPGLSIRHLHHIFVPRLASGHGSGPRVLNRKLQWPAVTVDTNAPTGSNNTPSDGYTEDDMLKYGSLIAVRPQDLAALRAAIAASTAGNADAREFCDRFAVAHCAYGAMPVDGGSICGYRGDAPLASGLHSAIRDVLADVDWWDWFYEVENAVTGATAVATSGPSYSGSIGTPTFPAGGGNPLNIDGTEPPPPETQWAPPTDGDAITARTYYTQLGATGFLFRARDLGSMATSPTGGAAVSNGSPVGLVRNHLAPNDLASALTATDFRPTYVSGATPAWRFVKPTEAVQGQGLVRLGTPGTEATQHFFLVMSSSGSMSAPQTAAQLGRWRLALSRQPNVNSPALWSSVNAFLEVGGGYAPVPTLFEIKITNTTQGYIRRNGGSWVGPTNIAQWFATNVSNFILGRSSYSDPNFPDFIAMTGDVYAVAWMDRVGNEGDEGLAALRRHLTEGLGITGLEVPEAPPPVEEGYLREVPVTSQAQLATALANAIPGDDIVCTDFAITSALTLSRSGTQANPIRVRGVNIPSASVGPNLQTTFNLSGNWLRLERFRGTTTGQNIQILGDYCKVMRFYSTGSANGQGVIRVNRGADRAEVGYNTIVNFGGRGILVKGGGNDIGVDPYIHHNYIQGSTLTGVGSGSAAILVGEGRTDTFRVFRARLSYNLVEDHNTTVGAIEFKGSGNIMEFCTLRNSNAVMETRFGQDNDHIGCSVINSWGVQVSGRRCRIINCYRDNLKTGSWTSHGAGAGNGTLEQYAAGSFSEGSYPRSEDCLISGCTGAVVIGSRVDNASWPALRTTIEAHTGAVTLRQGANGPLHSQTIDNRNGPQTVSFPGYVILQPSDVGVGAGL